jgi:DNA-binding MarR family transcriptional regulator
VGPDPGEVPRIAVDEAVGRVGHLFDRAIETIHDRPPGRTAIFTIRKYSRLYDMAMDDAYPGPTVPMLGARLRTAAEAVHAAIYRQLGDLGFGDIRPGHFALLKFPGPHRARPTELAARVGLSKQALNPVLNELEAMGYLHRLQDDGDRRGRIVHLTPRGMALVRALRETLEAIEDRLRGRVGEGAFEQFLQVLDLVGESCDQPVA